MASSSPASSPQEETAQASIVKEMMSDVIEASDPSTEESTSAEGPRDETAAPPEADKAATTWDRAQMFIADLQVLSKVRAHVGSGNEACGRLDGGEESAASHHEVTEPAVAAPEFSGVQDAVCLEQEEPGEVEQCVQATDPSDGQHHEESHAASAACDEVEWSSPVDGKMESADDAGAAQLPDVSLLDRAEVAWSKTMSGLRSRVAHLPGAHASSRELIDPFLIGHEEEPAHEGAAADGGHAAVEPQEDQEADAHQDEQTERAAATSAAPSEVDAADEDEAPGLVELVAMGFEEQEARTLLIASDMNLEVALECLLAAVKEKNAAAEHEETHACADEATKAQETVAASEQAGEAPTSSVVIAASAGFDVVDQNVTSPTAAEGVATGLPEESGATEAHDTLESLDATRMDRAQVFISTSMSAVRSLTSRIRVPHLVMAA